MTHRRFLETERAPLRRGGSFEIFVAVQRRLGALSLGFHADVEAMANGTSQVFDAANIGREKF